MKQSFFINYQAKSVLSKSLIFYLVMLFCVSCSDFEEKYDSQDFIDSKTENNNNAIVHFNSIDTVMASSKVNPIKTNINDQDFLYGRVLKCNLEFPGETKHYYENKSYYLVENTLDPNSFLAKVTDKVYGIDKYVYFKYDVHDDYTATVHLMGLNNSPICDLDVKISDGLLSVTNVYDYNINTKGIAPCNIAALAAGIVVGAASSTIVLGFMAGVVFALLEDYLCDNTIYCPMCGASNWTITEDLVICRICHYAENYHTGEHVTQLPA